VLTIALGILFALFQGPQTGTQTGTIVGLVKPEGNKPAQPARVVLLTPKYTELWDKQVQQRLDNYWELYKPQFAAHKEQFNDIYRIVYLESFSYVASTMRRELGVGAAKFIRNSSPTGEFEFEGIPVGPYQILINTTAKGQDVVWIRTVDVQSDIPVFVDLGKPNS